jgi:hypothetical protein
MKPAPKRALRIALLCAFVGNLALWFWLRRHGHGEAADWSLLLGVVLMIAQGSLRSGTPSP